LELLASSLKNMTVMLPHPRIQLKDPATIETDREKWPRLRPLATLHWTEEEHRLQANALPQKMSNADPHT
jgi:hypothetical protein